MTTEERYRPQTLYQAGGSAVADAFHNQSLYCRANDAPITARVLRPATACHCLSVSGLPVAGA